MDATALILGILGVISSWIPFLGLILGGLAAIFGVYSYTSKHKGIAGIVLGIIAMVFGLFVLAKPNTVKDIDNNIAQSENVIEEKQEIDEETFKSECIEKTYEELARNPDNVKGSNVKVTGEVIQVMESSEKTELRINITKSDYGLYSDTIYVTYTPEAGEDKILEDDIITIWGTAEGDYSYTSIMGATVTLPKIDAKYIQINK